MKKVKTVLFSLLMAFASSFMTACSCSMGGGDTGPVDQVLETAIAIECTSSNVEVTTHEETGYLTIRCHKGSKFTIKYTLTPDNATTTRVNWDYVGADDVLSCDRNTYSQTVSEPVTFVAKNVGNTVIQFESDATKKTTQATVIVGDVPEALPTFVSVSKNDFSYDINKAELSWKPVNKQILADGSVTASTQTGGIVAGLTGYEVHITDLTNDVNLETVVTAEPKISLPKGIEYAVSVIAKGDTYTVKDSAMSEAFKFCQLESATNLKNENGKISYHAPKFTGKSIVYFSKDLSVLKEIGDYCPTESLPLNFEIDKKYPDLITMQDYTISIVSEPIGYVKTQGYAEAGDNIKYYPSTRSEEISIKRIPTPTLEVRNVQSDLSVGSEGYIHSFSNAYEKTEIHWNSLVTGIDVKYGYAVYNGTTKVFPSNDDEYVIVENGKFDTSTLWAKNVKGACTIKVYAFGDSATTIPSKVENCTQYFYSLSPLDLTTKIDKNTLTPSSAEGNLYGLELFFVNRTNLNNSNYYFKSGEADRTYPLSQMVPINISQIGLSAGEYDVYARHVGIPTSAEFSAVSASSELVKISVTPVEVCDNVQTLKVTRDGILRFANVNGVSNYTIKVVQTDVADPNKVSTLGVDIGMLGVGETSSYSDPGYSQKTENGINYNYISIYDVIGNYLLNYGGLGIKNDATPEEIDQIVGMAISGFTADSKQLQFSIVSNKESCISSNASGVVEMKRLNNIPTVSLNNYVLSFDTLGQNVSYVIEIGGNSADRQEVRTGKVTINLNSTNVTTGDTSKTLKDLINATGSTEIKIYALGSDANKGNTGRLNSVRTSVTFVATETPDELGVDDAGFLTFRTNSEGDVDRTFTITFLATDGTKRIESVTLQKMAITPPPADGGEDEEGDENEGVEPASEVQVSNYDYFSVNILNYIIGGDENPLGGAYPSFIDKITGITIAETNSSKFTGMASNSYYVYMLPKLNIEKVMHDEDGLDETTEDRSPAVKFNAVTGLLNNENDHVIYTLTVSSANFTNDRVYTDKLPNTDILLNSILKQLNSDDILVGEYTVSLMPTFANFTNSGSSVNLPFVFSYESTELLITVKLKEITVNASGKNIVWEGIENATYTFRHKKEGESSWSPAKDIGSVTEYNVYTTFGAGAYIVEVTPYVNYTDYGVYLVGNPKSNTINKLKQPDNLQAKDGDLLFYTYNQGVKLNINLVIGGASLTAEEFLAESDDVTDETTGEYRYTVWTITNIASTYTGSNVITVTVTSAGYIDSAVSGEYTAVRLAPPTVGEDDFTKVGNKIYWKPIEKANKYLITFTTASDPKTYTLLIEGGEYKVWGQTASVDGDGKPTTVEAWLPGAGIFGIETEGSYIGSLYFVFNESEVVNGVAGVYNVTINAYTTESGYLNSATSATYTITKLENAVTVSTGSDNTSSIVIKGYDNHGNTDPIYVTYTIERYKANDAVVPDPDDGEGEPAGQADGEEEGGENTPVDPDEGEPLPPQITILQTYQLSEPILFADIKDNLINPESAGWIIDLDKIVDASGKPIFASEGTYRISIKFIGNGNELLDSEIFTKDGLEKLPASTLRTDTGVLTWGSEEDGTKGVSSYSLLIKENGAEDSTGIQINDLKADATTHLATLTNADLEASGFTFATNTLYIVKVRSNGAGKISSNWSEEFKVMKLMAPTALTVSTTSGGKPILTWDDENNTNIKSKYVFAYDENEANWTTINNTDGATSTLIGYELNTGLAVGSYTLRLKTIGNSSIGTSAIGLLSSDFTDDNASKVVHYIANQSNPGIVNGGLVWDTITNENGDDCVVKYKLTISSNNGDNVRYLTETNYNFLNSDIVDTGKYSITIDAVTDPSIAIISTHADTVNTNTTSLYSSDMLTDFMVKDGNLSWSIDINDIKTFVSANKEDIVKYAAAKINVPVGTNDETLIANAVIDYVKKVVNEGVVEIKDGKETLKPDLVDFLSFMYSFNMSINGVNTTVYADNVEAVTVTTNVVDGETIREYTPVTSNFVNAQRLMFTYVPKLTAEIATEDGSNATVDTHPGRYTLKVASKGNSSRVLEEENTPAPAAATPISTIAVTSSRYTDEFVVYKPNTPKTWSREDANNNAAAPIDEVVDGSEGSEGGETPSVPETVAPRGIVEGNVLWGLVTTDNSYIEEDENGNLVGNFEFHSKYEIIAKPVENPNSLGVKVKVDTDETYDAGEGVNTNLFSGNRYFKHVTSLFNTEEGSNHVSPNTNYNLTINVAGTVDSSLITDPDEKIYLNSDKYLYGNVMNILKNVGTSAKNSSYSWANSNGSTATKVVIYGPFDYAPIDAEDLDVPANKTLIETYKTNNPTTTLTDTEILLTYWKSSKVSNKWSDLFDPTYKAEVGDPRRIEKVFFNDASAAGQNSFTISKEIENYIDESLDFAAGSYIIRKQEIGDRRGVIDTEFSEELFEQGEPDYGTIVNKLDMVTKVGTSWLGAVEFNKENVTTATQGQFIWNKVPRANAYQVVLQEINSQGVAHRETQTLLLRDTDSSKDYMVYDLPNESYNNSECTYRIKIVAVKVDGEGQLMDNYFSSDPVTTDDYIRVDIPMGLKITGDGQISWTANASSTIHSYLIRVNDNYDQPVQVEFAGFVGENNTVLLNIGDMKEDATYRISIKAVANAGYINSSYTTYVEITKLGSPNAKVEEGEFMWGPAGVEIGGGNPTETSFKLTGEVTTSETLNAEIITYPLYTEILTYDQEYQLSNEMYPAGEYTYSVQFKGSEGDIVPGQAYYIVSKPTNYNVTKLETPILSEADNTDGENKINWKAIDNATGYKVFIISSDNESYSEIIYLSDTKGMITVNGDDITLSLSKFLNREVANKFIDKLTSGVKVYIQAIGTIEGNEETVGTQYVNSSYSDFNLFKTPNPAIDGGWDSEKGIISWTLEEDDKKDMDIFLTTTYTVQGVSVEEYTNYWTQSIGSGNAILTALGISTRQVSYTTRQVVVNEESVTVYDLTVIDTVYIKKVGNTTPTSYQLTNYGTNYKVDVVVMSEYSSQAYSFGYGTLNPITINFTTFAGGDGTENLPYKVYNEVSLNAIRNFPSKHFKLTDDITLTNVKQIQISLTYSIPTTWDIINNFSGVIDGKKNDSENYKIKNVITPNGLSDGYLAMFNVNSGTIKNLDIELTTNVTSYSGMLQAAGVAITNEGLIDNVKVVGNIIAMSSNDSVDIGGITIYNYGTINNSSFNMPNTITSGLEYTGLYASTASASHSAIVAGIATYNGILRDGTLGIIKTSHFDGDITGNMMGGIAYESYGDIEKCYTSGNAYVSGASGKSVEYGGLVGRIFGKSSIINSYTQLVVTVTVTSSTGGSIGGLVGNYDTNSLKANGSTISGCYAVLDVTFSATNSAVNVYALMPGNTNVTCENNTVYSKVTFTLNGGAAANIVTDITALNNLVANVKDGGVAVYKTDNKDGSGNPDYPTFA